ncbi:flagellar hook-length control protein FliK [Roseomonas terrae]|uniref:Flagellar hook-length control protein FliK n=1 Tax=Neoroseomonas terrae TaxID=424799 RepID=A0ABS5EHL5_9PROT|nr:flagellar hook-length control protein FliK [Neoroseomonas terrae]MBR0650518.1 flagellar hook-length control protein FliK [Neoroseomonas terrae]
MDGIASLLAPPGIMTVPPGAAPVVPGGQLFGPLLAQAALVVVTGETADGTNTPVTTEATAVPALAPATPAMSWALGMAPEAPAAPEAIVATAAASGTSPVPPASPVSDAPPAARSGPEAEAAPTAPPAAAGPGEPPVDVQAPATPAPADATPSSEPDSTGPQAEPAAAQAGSAPVPPLPSLPIILALHAGAPAAQPPAPAVAAGAMSMPFAPRAGEAGSFVGGAASRAAGPDASAPVPAWSRPAASGGEPTTSGAMTAKPDTMPDTSAEPAAVTTAVDRIEPAPAVESSPRPVAAPPLPPEPVEPVGAAAPPAGPAPSSPSAQDLSTPRSAGAVPQATPGRQIAPVLVAVAIAGGTARLSVTLEPAELGRVEISVERRGEATDIRVVAERPETLALIQRDQRELDRTLTQAGIGSEGRSLSFNLSDGGGGGFAQQRGDDAGRAARGPPGAPGVGPTDTPPQPPRRLLSLLDLAV